MKDLKVLFLKGGEGGYFNDADIWFHLTGENFILHVWIVVTSAPVFLIKKINLLQLQEF